MHFIVVGLNYKTASIAVREKVHFSNEILPAAYQHLKNYPSIHGCLILSTCNRVEIYASAKIIEDGLNAIEEFLCAFHNVDKQELQQSLYRKNCQFAVSHLFKVSSSLDSMVIGEYQIQGQVRDAYFMAIKNDAVNNMVNKLFQMAIQIGKKVRSETEIGKGSVSIATLAVELIKQVFQKEHDFHALLIGAGKISSLTAENLQPFHTKISIANRSLEKAEALAEKFNGTVVAYQNRLKAIADNDIIIVSTSSEDYIINKNEIIEILSGPDKKLRIFIDLSIPRNIDPEINDLENCHLYTIDDINNLKISNLSERSKEVDKAEKIIVAISEDYYDWYSKLFIIPTMQEFKNELAVLKQKTIASYKPLISSFDDKQQELVNKVLDSYSELLIKVVMKNIKNVITKENLISMTQSLKNSFTTELNED